MDIDCPTDTIEESVEGFEPAVVLPAVDILVVYFNQILAQLLHDVLRDTSLSHSRRAVQKDRISRSIVCHSAQDTG
jgi:hypothetical protein